MNRRGESSCYLSLCFIAVLCVVTVISFNMFNKIGVSATITNSGENLFLSIDINKAAESNFTNSFTHNILVCKYPVLLLSVVAAVVDFAQVIHSSTFELLLHLVYKDTNTLITNSFHCYCFLHYHFARKKCTGRWLKILEVMKWKKIKEISKEGNAKFIKEIIGISVRLTEKHLVFPVTILCTDF